MRGSGPLSSCAGSIRALRFRQAGTAGLSGTDNRRVLAVLRYLRS